MDQDYSDSFYDSNDWSSDASTTTEAPQQETPQQPQFDPNQYVPREQFEQVNQQVQGIQNWFQNNPFNPQQQHADPERQKVYDYLNGWAKDNGMVSQQDLLAYQEVSSAEQVAKQNGFANFPNAYNYYAYAVNEALATGQRTVEAQQIADLANRGQYTQALSLATKVFGKPHTGVPNVNIQTNHAPDNSQFQNNQNQGYYGSPQYHSDRHSTDPRHRVKAQRAHDEALKQVLGF